MEHGDTVTIETGWPGDPGGDGGAVQELTCGELAAHLQDSATGAGQQLYALLDAARGAPVMDQVASAGLDAGAQYEVLGPGRQDDELFATSAFLVPCPEGSELLWWLCTEGMQQSLGVLLASVAPLEELAAHLHPLTEIKDERGRTLLFRFYDPRVLRIYLPTCTPWELRRFFGPVQRFWAEAAETPALLDFPRPALAPEDEPEAEELLAGQTIIAEDRPDLVIREAQLEAFAGAVDAGLHRRLAAHLRDHFPDDCAELGEEGLGEVVEQGVERAAAHGFEVERDVALYLGLVFVLGPEFDEDPALPWARRVLEDPRLETAGARMDALWAEAEQRLTAMSGASQGAA